jgi:uncharacterized protein YndB with AHSA1/START domain
MKFTAKEDIKVPIDHVFAAVTDFDRFERQGLRRGADIQRKDKNDSGVVGMGTEWRVKFRFRGKERKLKTRVVAFEAPNSFRTHTNAGSIESDFDLDLVALSPNTTRLSIQLELRANTLAGRLLVQSLKFAKGNLSRRFSNRIWQFAQTIEEDYERSARSQGAQ